MMSEYDLGLRFHKQPRKKRPTPERSDLGNPILTMTDKEIFNTFASVIDCPSASPFLKRLAQAGLVACDLSIHEKSNGKAWPESILELFFKSRQART
jgi:hypothetical protein